MPLVFRIMLLKETVKVFCGYTRFLVNADDDDDVFSLLFVSAVSPASDLSGISFFILTEDGYSIRFNSLRLHLINLYFCFKKSLLFVQTLSCVIKTSQRSSIRPVEISSNNSINFLSCSLTLQDARESKCKRPYEFCCLVCRSVQQCVVCCKDCISLCSESFSSMKT